MRWTSEKTWKHNSPANSSFIYDRFGFVKNPFRGLDYVKQNIVPFLGGGEVVVNAEVMYQKNKLFSSFTNSSILVIGGGPSASKLPALREDYDYVVSCNHFFLNDSITKMGVDLAIIGDEVDISSNRFLDYVENSNTLFCFENIGRNLEELKNFKDKYPNRVVWAHTRYHSKIGAVVRIISLLCNLSPRAISVIGMDGYVRDAEAEKYQHAFEGVKRGSGTIESGNTEDNIEKKYYEQYLEFWDYVLHDVGNNIEFYNLGHGHPRNFSSKVLTEQLTTDYQLYLSNPASRTA